MSLLTRVIVATLVLCWSVAPVLACINDRDTLREEQQFKALYPDTPSEGPAAQPEFAPFRVGLLAYGAPIVGVALLGGAGCLTLNRRVS